MEGKSNKHSPLKNQLRKSCIITLIELKVATVCTIKRADCMEKAEIKKAALKSTH